MNASKDYNLIYPVYVRNTPKSVWCLVEIGSEPGDAQQIANEVISFRKQIGFDKVQFTIVPQLSTEEVKEYLRNIDSHRNTRAN